MAVFINLSNHPSSRWADNQIAAAREYGEIVDIIFPEIDPTATCMEISRLADEYCERIREYSVAAVMVQGEFTFSYALIKRLTSLGIKVVAACTQRNVGEELLSDGTLVKKTVFSFCGFRAYE